MCVCVRVCLFVLFRNSNFNLLAIWIVSSWAIVGLPSNRTAEAMAWMDLLVWHELNNYPNWRVLLFFPGIKRQNENEISLFFFFCCKWSNHSLESRRYCIFPHKFIFNRISLTSLSYFHSWFPCMPWHRTSFTGPLGCAASKQLSSDIIWFRFVYANTWLPPNPWQ